MITVVPVRAHRADGREDALAHVPQRGRFGGVGGEAQRRGQRRALQHFGDGVDLDRQRHGRGPRAFQPAAAAPSSGSSAGRRHAGLVLHRAQRGAVEQFHRYHRAGLEPRHGAAGGFQPVKEDQCAGLVRVFFTVK
jgi:hypothetical protein